MIGGRRRNTINLRYLQQICVKDFHLFLSHKAYVGVKDGEGMKRNNAFFIKSNNMTVKETHTTKTYTKPYQPSGT